jgi:MFS family permease
MPHTPTLDGATALPVPASVVAAGDPSPSPAPPSVEVAPLVPPRPLFRDTAVLGWALARAVSDIGDAVAFVAIAYAAARLGSPAVAGLVLAAAATPRAIFMLIGGAITDRVDTRRLMIGTDLARIAVLIAALVAIAVWGVSAPLLIAIGVPFGIADALYIPASATFPRQLVATGELARLAGLRQLMTRIATIVGGPLGLALVAVGGLSAALAADAVSFVVIAVVLVAVRPRWPRGRSAGRSVVGDVRSGLGYLGRTPPVRDLVIALSGLNVFGAPVLSVGIALRTTQQGWSPTGLGLLTGCIGAGAAVGTLAVMAHRPQRPVLFGLQLMFVQAAAVAAVGVLPYPGEVTAMLVVGVTAGLASPLLSGAVQAVVAEQFLGRTSAVLSIADTGLAPLALAGFGLLVSTSNLAAACLAFGLAFAVLMVFAVSRPHLAELTPAGK